MADDGEMSVPVRGDAQVVGSFIEACEIVEGFDVFMFTIWL